ncbi:MAG: hypothetical protein RLZZ111_1137 [Planctomycetota bacterium]|jgi:hypothetical protein
MAPQTARSVDRTLKKMMKQAARSAAPAASSANGSVNTAAQALANMAEIQKRLARGDTEAARALAAKPLAPPSFAAGSSPASASGPASGAGEPAAAVSGKRPGLTAIIGGGLAAAVVAGVAVWMLTAGASHSVAGTVMLDQRPLAHVEVSFHPKAGAAPPIRVTSSAQGGFHVPALPAGEYAIVLSSADAAGKLPRKYLSPESTPFRLKLTKSRSDLRMLASTADGK